MVITESQEAQGGTAEGGDPHVPSTPADGLHHLIRVAGRSR